MVKLYDIQDKDYKKHKDIFDYAEYLFGWTREDAKKIIDGDNYYILFGYKPIFMLFRGKSPNVEHKSWVVDDDGKVISMTMDGYQVNVDKQGIYLIDENGNHQSVQLLRNNEEVPFELNTNGVLNYMQYDSKRDLRMVLKYEQNVYGDNGMIYSDYLHKPFYISVETKPLLRDKGLFFLGRKDAYYRLDFDIYKNRWQYDLATMQEFGIGASIANDTITLHSGERSFSRYYKELFRFGDYFSLTGFPFFRQYSDKEIDTIIEEFAFNKEIPQFVASTFNNRFQIIREFQDITDEYLKEKQNIKRM